MAFVAPQAGHLPFHDAGETYVDAHQQHHHPFANHASMSDRFPPHVPHHMSCDIKPRLTKEQHDILEAHYQKQQKPNTNTKKGFADSLGVTLDKVNNWFQNRRAKSKQDAKKQAGAFNLFAQQQPSSSANFASDSETSPSFTSADYFSMMQQCAADDTTSNGMSMSSMPQFYDNANGLPHANDSTPNEQYGNGAMGQQQLQGDMFDSPQEMNRRTLTQEQFDAFAQNGGMMRSGQFDALHNGFSGDADMLHQVFPEMQDFKSQDAFAFPAPIGAPLSSNDSSIPSTISEQSMFPSSTAMQEQHSISAPSSDWGDSRSSSVSLPQDNQFQQIPASQHPPTATSSQWQPGQSIPVDPNELQQQFREAAQRQQHLQQQQMGQHEQPLAWPADEAFVRRDSQNGTMLAQQMSSFAIQTPQPQQLATFKTPAHPGENTASIAVRRQRPKPQPLGMAALRSQSYSGAVQPGSPSGQQSQNLAAPGQQLRRIRSSNVINGGVAQGRVMKSVPGSAQRSPLNWTFADAATNSPKVMRHASSSSMGNLAPPTPMSPNEAAARQEQSRPQFPPWQSASGHFSRQASISETDAEHNVPIMPSQSVPPQPVSSPPHTPLYHHHHQQQQQSQQFSQGRVGNNVITENTPPQSAPAAQTSFPANAFMVPQQQQQQPQQMQTFMPQQQFMSASVPEQGFQVPATYGPAQHFVMPAPEGPPQMSMPFGNGGVPVVNAQGNLTMAYPPQMQQMHFIQHAPHSQGQQQPPHMQTPPQGGQQFSFVTTSGTSPGMNVTSQLPKPAQPASEFFVHEYSPPQDIKRTATPRKPPVDNGPKNYTFANQGPEHFEKEKVKKGEKSGTASNSPASATSSS